MRRRHSIRLTIAALVVALSVAGGGGVSAHGEPARVAPSAPSDAVARATALSETGDVSAGGQKIKPLRDRVSKGPVAKGRMSRASKRKSDGVVPSMPSPLTARPETGTLPSPLLAGPAPVEATLTSEPAISKPGFDGMSFSSGPDTAGEPPDPYLAVGPEHVMQVVNSSFTTTDRQGTLEQLGSLAGFIDTFPFDELDGASWFDPRILYDSLHGRWLLTVSGVDCLPDGINSAYGNGYVFFATSDTTDPTGFWTGSYLWYPDFLADFTAPGTSTDKMAFASNVFDMFVAGSCPNGDYVGADVVVVDWADWLDGGSFGTDGVSTSAALFTPRVAAQMPATSSRLHIVIESAGSGAGPDVRYFRLTGSAKAKTISVDADHNLSSTGVMGEFLAPPSPQQPGPDTVTDIIDERPTDAIWQNETMTFVANYPCTPSGDSTERVCVRVSQLDTTGVSSTNDPAVRQDFLVAENGADSYFGGVGVAGNGTLHVVWTRSSTAAADYPSSYAGHQLPTDGANTISPAELIKAGTGTYTGSRWGDYVGVAQDPFVPSAVWQGNQYSGGGSEWKTYIARLQPEGTTFVPITPLRVLDTRTPPIGLSGKFTANSARTWQVGGVGTIPADAVAVTGNVTVTQQEAAGYIAVTPTTTNTPPSSTLNFPLGDNRANNLTVPLSSTGKLSAVYKAGSGKKTHLVFDVTGYFLADDSGATFTTLTPTRVLDSRLGTGLPGGLPSKFVSGTPRTLTVADGVDIPLTATAITGNLTVTQQSAPGYLAVTKEPTGNPTTSSLNFPVSDNRANGLFAPLNASGQLSIVYKATTGAQTHVVLDVTGYFEPGTGGLRFVPLNPGRIMDTRSSAVLSGLSGTFAANTARVLAVDGHWGVPTGAAAITGNLTVTAQTGAGYVSVSPDPPPPVPATSTLNFPIGDNRANGLVTPLNGSGDSNLVYIGASGKTTHLILDLSGYFE